MNLGPLGKRGFDLNYSLLCRQRDGLEAHREHRAPFALMVRAVHIKHKIGEERWPAHSPFHFKSALRMEGLLKIETMGGRRDGLEYEMEKRKQLCNSEKGGKVEIKRECHLPP